MRRNFLAIFLAILVLAPMFVHSQDTGVTAEALGQANLRAQPDINSELTGEILSGTRYPVIGRSEFFPWVLLGDPVTLEPIGWVFRDLVQIIGDINQVPFATVDVNAQDVATVTQQPVSASPRPTASVTATIRASPTFTPSSGVIGQVIGEINVRYGPGVDYPVVGRAFAGEQFEITAYHSQFPWLQVRFEDSPNGMAWIARDLLEVQGDIFSLPVVRRADFDLPTLTPTPPVQQASDLPGTESGELSPGFVTLGNRIWNQILEAGFIPESSRFGALYLQDLQTGEALTFGNDIAFSGTSINKIAILVEYFAMLNGHPSVSEAVDMANTMICSENVATNRLLGLIGQGDEILGAEEVTLFLRRLGLQKTFLTAPFDTTTELATATPPPRPVRAPTTAADQTRANPNPTNQMTVEEMGWLLGTLYQCAYQESGPLMSEFDGMFTPQECRKALHVMSNNTVDALLKAGVPADTRVAHKHGWIADTHGNAAVFFTPGGDYVLVMMLYQPEWLEFSESLPLIAEVSRTVYNYYNPDQPMEAIREGYIPTTEECNYAGDAPLVGEIISPDFQAETDPSLFYQPDAQAVTTPTAGG